MTKKHRDYQNDYPSCTEILGVLRNIALENWFKMHNLKFINAASGKGRVAGTDIHTAIDLYIETGVAKVDTTWPDEVTMALKSFVLFKRENPQIVLKKSEEGLTSELYKFNGTIDCVGWTEEAGQLGIPLILDWKSSNAKEKEKPAIYDTYRYQLAAYVKLWNDVKKENIREALSVSIAKDKIAYNMYLMHEQEIDDCFNEVFLPALRIYNYQKRGSKNILL
jgi:hypothetical protein